MEGHPRAQREPVGRRVHLLVLLGEARLDVRIVVQRQQSLVELRDQDLCGVRLVDLRVEALGRLGFGADREGAARYGLAPAAEAFVPAPQPAIRVRDKATATAYAPRRKLLRFICVLLPLSTGAQRAG